MSSINLDLFQQRFFITLSDPPDSVYEAEFLSFVEKDEAKAFIHSYAPSIKALVPAVAATYFASYFGRACAALQYALWHDDTMPDLSLDNLKLHIIKHSAGTSLSFRMKTARFTAVDDSAREAWIYRNLKSFYSTQVRPLFDSVATASGVNAGTLWGQTATVMYYMYDSWLHEAESEEQKARLLQVFDLLIHKLDPEVFGRAKNPFNVNFRMVENPQQPGSMMRVKASCCLAYQTETGHGYCYTCPHLSEARREQMKKQMLLDTQT